MLNAEAVYFIITVALSDNEQKRLIAMLKNKKTINQKKKNTPANELKGWSEEEIRKKLLSTIFKGTKDL